MRSTMRLSILSILLPVVVTVVASGLAIAQEPGSDLDLSSPRATMRTLVEAFPEGGPDRPEQAEACIDWRGVDVPEADRAERARLLKRVIDRLGLEIANVPDRWGAPMWIYTEAIGTHYVQIARRDSEDPGSPWLFTAETAAVAGGMWEAVKNRRLVEEGDDVSFSESPARWLRSRMPNALLDRTILLENWQWLALLILCVIGLVLERIVALVIPVYVRRRLLRRRLEVGRRAARTGFRPFGILAMALFWGACLDWVGLPGRVAAVLSVAIRFLAALAAVWAAYRLVDVFTDVLGRRASATATKFDDLLIPLIRKSLKVFVTVVGLVFIASVLEIRVTSLLAGLGLGGLAFALAAKDTVSNLFGSLTVILDRPFQVGDWVVIGKAEGTVEEVGFRSTRIRTFYNSVITVPNGTLISAVVDNMGERRYRRLKTMLTLSYGTTSEKVDAFSEGVRELIRRHPYTRKDYFHVYLNGLSASSIDVLLYAFFEVPDWGTELRERHRLLNDILRLAERLGVEFAFPTRTVHLVREEKPSVGEPPLPTESGVEEAVEEGRREARAIVAGTLGEPPRKPDPVQIAVPEQENRGEAGDDGGE